MTQPQLRDLVKASNPVVTHQLLPDERDMRTLYAEAMQRAENPQTSVDLLEQPVERRPEVQTEERQTEFVPEKAQRTTRRRLVPALAAGLALIVAAGGLWAITRTSEPDVATPLEVTDLFNETVATADWSAASELYAADATYQWLFPGGQSEVIRFAEQRYPFRNLAELPGYGSFPDWDGDGIVTELDSFQASLGGEIYASGTTNFLSCSQPDGATSVCTEAREGYAFTNPAYAAQWTFTISDGLISSIVIEITAPNPPLGSNRPCYFCETGGVDPTAVAEYEQWVMENRPELVDDLFWLSGQRELTPENIDTHRELVAEWVAQP
jgi:hypothetical protein